MSFITSEEQIKLFMEMVPGVSQVEAIQRIKGSNNNVEQAINEYYDNPNTNKYSQYDSLSDNKQESDSLENHGISFKIQGDDISQPLSQFNTAPSRPPSRVNNKCSLEKRLNSTSEQIAGNYLNNEDQDPELTKALALSAQEAGLTPQETGNTSINQIYFGPATREVYDSNQWSMVPIGKTTSADSISEPEPVDRQREPGAPAFLKPASQNDYLGALISIYHEIPMIRNIFLNTTDVLNTYGFDEQWWMGKSIELDELETDQTNFLDINRELQRLMAFLDDTDRSYGSVKALASLPDVLNFSKAMDGDDKDCALLEAWRQMFQDSNPDVVDKIYSAGVASEDSEQDEKKFAILELSLPNHSFYENLYDICDECLWPELRPIHLSSSPYLSHIAEVITFKIEARKDQKNIKFPAVWYPDRYLKSYREASLEMRRKKYETQEEIDKISNIEDRLTMVTSKNGKLCTVKKMLETSLRHDEFASQEVISKNKKDADCDPKLAQNSTMNLSAELRKISESIDKKLAELKREKDALYAHLRHLSSLYTNQSSSPESQRLKPYSLRGLCTSNNTMYICRRTEVLDEMLPSQDESDADLDQWWRIHFFKDNPPIVTLEKTTTECVLKAASEESKNPILVYSSKEALSQPKEPLPVPLQTFVQRDNSFFKRELFGDQPNFEIDSLETTGQNGSVQPSGLASSSPGKRKYVYGDSDDTEVGSIRFDRGSYDESVFSMEAIPSSFDENPFSSKDKFPEKEQDEHNLIVGIDPSFTLENEGSSNMILDTPKCSSPPSSNQTLATVDLMDLDLPKENHDPVD